MLRRFSGEELFILAMAGIALIFVYSILLFNGESTYSDEVNDTVVEDITDEIEHIDEEYIYYAKARDNQ